MTTSEKQSNALKKGSIAKDKDKEKHMSSMKKQQQDASRKDSAPAKRMQELMRQFGTIFRQVILKTLISIPLIAKQLYLLKNAYIPSQNIFFYYLHIAFQFLFLFLFFLLGYLTI